MQFIFCNPCVDMLSCFAPQLQFLVIVEKDRVCPLFTKQYFQRLATYNNYIIN